MSPLRRLSLSLSMVCLCVAAHRAGAQERTLHWRSMDVDARLDSAGRLHVRERQEMVFTGEWNGGERRFDVRVGQQFQFGRLLVVDSVSGAERPLAEGDLDEVDRFGWGDNRTLRWRSRRPSDPPFRETRLTYILEYTYADVVTPKDGSYLLSHDFAFADRAGPIETFTLSLDVHRAWRPGPGFRGTYGPVRLEPGEGFVVTVPLEYVAAGRPSGVEFPPPASSRFLLAAVLVGGFLVLGLQLYRRERSSGRFAPLLPTAQIDEAWVRANVLHMLPEVVGAAWDGSTGSAEVAAMLARMVGEKKLASRVETTGRGLFQQHVLHLELLTDREKLAPHERALVGALFSGSARKTDTKSVRERYKATGFDPASKIRGALEGMLAASNGFGKPLPKPSRRPTLVLLLVAVGLLVMGGVRRPQDAVLAAVAAVPMLLAYVIALTQAAFWRSRVRRLGLHALRFLIPLGAIVGAVLMLLVSGFLQTGLPALAGAVCLALAAVSSVMNMAKSRQSVELIVTRKRLAAAREYFRDQLRQPEPALRDEWYPYFLAFGLGSHVDKWFRAFGGEAGVASSGVSTMAASRSSSGSGWSGGSGGSWSGFGGGGGFAGGGSSGVWAAAAGSMAAGVSAPSSSSGSSGGSSGGGSSGGGGGGGW